MENKKKIIKHIEDCLATKQYIHKNYEKLPKCLIKFIEIGTLIKIEKNGEIYRGGQLYRFYGNNIIIKYYDEYVYVDVDEYNIYIYNTDLRYKKIIKKNKNE